MKIERTHSVERFQRSGESYLRYVNEVREVDFLINLYYHTHIHTQLT